MPSKKKSNNKVFFLILFRDDSTRLKQKCLLTLNNKTYIEIGLEKIHRISSESNDFDSEIFVASNKATHFHFLEKYIPEENHIILEKERRPIFEIVKDFIEDKNLGDDDILALFYCTRPFVRTDDIVHMILKSLTGNYDVVHSICPAPPRILNSEYEPIGNWEIKNGLIPLTNEVEPSYHFNSIIECYKVSALKKNLCTIHPTVYYHKVDKYSSLDIDNFEDHHQAMMLVGDVIYKHNNKAKPKHIWIIGTGLSLELFDFNQIEESDVVITINLMSLYLPKIKAKDIRHYSGDRPISEYIVPKLPKEIKSMYAHGTRGIKAPPHVNIIDTPLNCKRNPLFKLAACPRILFAISEYRKGGYDSISFVGMDTAIFTDGKESFSTSSLVPNSEMIHKKRFVVPPTPSDFVHRKLVPIPPKPNSAKNPNPYYNHTITLSKLMKQNKDINWRSFSFGHHLFLPNNPHPRNMMDNASTMYQHIISSNNYCGDTSELNFNPPAPRPPTEISTQKKLWIIDNGMSYKDFDMRQVKDEDFVLTFEESNILETRYDILVSRQGDIIQYRAPTTIVTRKDQEKLSYGMNVYSKYQRGFIYARELLRERVVDKVIYVGLDNFFELNEENRLTYKNVNKKQLFTLISVLSSMVRTPMYKDSFVSLSLLDYCKLQSHGNNALLSAPVLEMANRRMEKLNEQG